MRQQSFTAEDFEIIRKRKRVKKNSPKEIGSIVPWSELSKATDPYYLNPAKAGRKPIGIERMLRIHFLQHWFEYK